MKYEVDSWNNFCRVFKLPTKFSNEYCFGGGQPTNFQMIDWFNPVISDELFSPAISKESWEEKSKNGEISEWKPAMIDGDELQGQLIKFLKGKNYVKHDVTYLVLCDFGLTFTFSGD